MFNDSKYTIVYYKIINNAKNKTRKKGSNDYYESHHITPRSLGGNNSATNKVLLTAKEHYICHLLLTKMTSGINKQKMSYALWNISNVPGNKHQKRHKLSSRAYEMVRRIVQQNSRKEWSKEYKESMKEVWCKSLKPNYAESNSEFKGYYHTPWGKFATRQAAASSSPIKGIDPVRIRYACKENERIVKRRRPSNIPMDWIGKSYKELGFWFEEIA